MAGKTDDRSILRGESIELFRAAIKSPATRDPYERRLIQFLNIIKLAPDDFTEAAKKNSSSIEKQIISFISKQNSRAEKGELNWKKIRRVLPRARRYALDRIPTVEEIREIVDAADVREKALTLVFVSSEIREGAIEYLTVGDYSIIEIGK